MGSSFYLHVFMLLCCCFHLFIMLTNSSSSAQPLCHEDESSSLLQFKHSFLINKFASVDRSARSKVESWKKFEGKSGDCCSWDGVECDHNTGHVVGLDLSSSFLYGSINSNSSLFNLVHLQRLNLSDNHFNYSQIPSRIGKLPSLRSLNLSNSAFLSQIPSNISYLSKLVYLDLSGNALKLEKPNLEDLVQNLTSLKVLDLSWVNISFTVTRALSNMSSLTTLFLESCQLYGEFPTTIFQLPNLQILRLAKNYNLTGNLPEFHLSSPLKQLDLQGCNFSGMLPVSLGSVTKLTYLDLSMNQFWGQIPASLGSVTELTYLDLSVNQFWGQIPASLGNLSQLTVLVFGGENNFDAPTLPLTLGKLSKLTDLYLADIKIRGEIPQFLANLTQLSTLLINSNELVGQIPSWLMNLTKLTRLEITDNQLHGMIPNSISQLKYLEWLDLNLNNLSGEVELDIFSKLQNLAALQLSGNKLTVVTKNITNATLPKFNVLGLESCNMKEFPNFLQFQDELEVLFFDNNKIQGEIPTWFWNNTKENIQEVYLEYNFLTGFEQHPDVIPWRSLLFLDLSFNRLQGSLPIPPLSTIVYKATGNSLSGEIPPSIICHNSSLKFLDLSDNNFSGTIPQCLPSCSDSLQVLNLSHNNFHGTIPDMIGINLKLIDLSQNQLHGLAPRSLENCTMLEILLLGNNQMEGTFPSWLGALPKLQVLILRSNRFHGAINVSQAKLKFAKLRIIDLSNNGFSGNLPSEFFENWNAMTMVQREKLTYMQASQDAPIGIGNSRSGSIILYTTPYMYSVTMDNKGTHRVYAKIQTAFIAIDLSNNKFGGEIPESLGRLNGLQMLNLFNNSLTGVIPSSLANLTELESLDLSQNLLSGEIPQQLSQLTFLEFLNVSHNHLTGLIPRGNQFDTFENSSYDGNSGLCGYPLSQLCGNSEASPPPSLSFHGDDSKFPSGVVDWIIISLGYGSGLIVGLVIGRILTTRYHEWFVEKFGTRKQTQKRVQRKGRRN